MDGTPDTIAKELPKISKKDAANFVVIAYLAKIRNYVAKHAPEVNAPVHYRKSKALQKMMSDVKYAKILRVIQQSDYYSGGTYTNLLRMI